MEHERHRRAQEERDAAAARNESIRAKAQARLDAAARALAKREESVAKRERISAATLEEQMAKMRHDFEVRIRYFKVQRGLVMAAFRQRMKQDLQVLAGVVVARAQKTAKERADAMARVERDKADLEKRLCDSERRERERIATLEARAAALANDSRKRALYFRVRRGILLVAQRNRMKLDRGVFLAVEIEREKRAKAERDAEAARLEAERARSQAKLEQMARAHSKREEDLEKREREASARLASQLAELQHDSEARLRWGKVRRGILLYASRHRMKMDRLVLAGIESARAEKAAAERAAAMARIEREKAELDRLRRESDRRESDKLQAIEARAAALAHERHMHALFFRVRAGILRMAQKKRMQVGAALTAGSWCMAFVYIPVAV